jgi:hypothetical protein
MRFMVMHKNDKHTEAGERPSPELIAQMGAYIGEHAQKGQFVDGAGLGASATRTRLTFRGGEATVKHGPYAGVHELVSSILLLQVKQRSLRSRRSQSINRSSRSHRRTIGLAPVDAFA